MMYGVVLTMTVDRPMKFLGDSCIYYVPEGVLHRRLSWGLTGDWSEDTPSRRTMVTDLYDTRTWVAQRYGDKIRPVLRLSPERAHGVAGSKLMRTCLNQSVFGPEKLLNGKGRNARWGLPDFMFGWDVVVEELMGELTGASSTTRSLISAYIENPMDPRVRECLIDSLLDDGLEKEADRMRVMDKVYRDLGDPKPPKAAFPSPGDTYIPSFGGTP